jgi:hypothetical protein
MIGLPFDDLAALGTLTVVAAAAVPYAPGPRASLALAAAAAGQWAINVVAPPDGPGVDAFLNTFL